MSNEPAETFDQWAIVEQWRAVTGYEGLYEVGDLGRVRRVGRAATRGNGQGGGARIGRVLRDQPVSGGYRVVQLWRDGKPNGHLVHCLVAVAFLGPVPDGKEVNHKNGVKRDNTLGNLEYLTRPENMEHAYRTGLRIPTTAEAVAARRKPRSMIPCACGCGALLESLDRKGRERRFIHNHHRRAA